MNIASNTTTLNHADMDLEQLYSEQADAQAMYELAMTYKSFGFRDKAIIEFYRLCDQRTESAKHYAARLAPMLFH